MSAVDVTARYVTADFKTSPLIALADRCKINHAIIYEGPKGHLQSNLMGLIGEL